MPLGRAAVTGLTRPLTSAGLLTSLSYVQRGYDRAELGGAAGRSITAVPSTSTPTSISTSSTPTPESARP